ncbi:MAG: prolyl oligopeptidase family serine peptidase [Verrucomicrobia bacterium]|nr:prolyl oligopeptidase family serine peptidase [Verrucomicrobiota bacterium]
MAQSTHPDPRIKGNGRKPVPTTEATGKIAPNKFSRRHMLKTIAASGSALAVCGPPTNASQPGSTANVPGSIAAPTAPLNRFPRMVQEYFVGRVRAITTASRRRLESLQTKAEAEAYVAEVRERIRACFGPFPEKTPLNPRVTRVIDRGAYRIENIVFESRPGFMVTGNLYVPQSRTLPLPGVIGVCGHSDNGKAAESYQSFSQGLARMGYVVFIIDPLGQGERLQYPDAGLKSRIGVGVREHLHAGNQQFLVGEFIGTWRAWDAIRALDYLLTRKEVDQRHIGVTGNSGGGTMTTWLCGLDERWTMAAPSCFVTTFRRNLENELPADTEQCPPRAIALGLDHEDFIAAMAPKPVIILAKELDYFDVRGTEEAFGRLKHLYSLLGAGENIAMFAGPTPHGFSKENREAMYRWFNRITGISNAEIEPELVLEKDETLWCAPKGQVVELKSRTVPGYTAERSRSLSAQRARPGLGDLQRAVIDMLRLPPRHRAPDYRILRPISGRGYPLPHAAVYAVETEPGIQAVVYRLGPEPLASRPSGKPSRAILYVAHHSSDAELRSQPLVRQLFSEEPEAAFYTCDVRGIGESRPDTCGSNSFLDPYGSDYFYAIHSIMLDQPYVGQKTHDVLSVLDWLKAHGHTEVHLAACGWGTLPATFAALLSELVVQVTLKNALTAYADVAESELYSWPLSCFVPGVLSRFDLPDCYSHLKTKNLRQIDPSHA